jgi:hypothetical protein
VVTGDGAVLIGRVRVAGEKVPAGEWAARVGLRPGARFGVSRAATEAVAVSGSRGETQPRPM